MERRKVSRTEGRMRNMLVLSELSKERIVDLVLAHSYGIVPANIFLICYNYYIKSIEDNEEGSWVDINLKQISFLLNESILGVNAAYRIFEELGVWENRKIGNPRRRQIRINFERVYSMVVKAIEKYELARKEEKTRMGSFYKISFLDVRYIYINNYNNILPKNIDNIKNNNKPSQVNKVKPRPKEDPTKLEPYIRLAKRLSRIIKKHKKSLDYRIPNHTTATLKSWATHIKRLVLIDKVDIHYVGEILTGYKEIVGQQYVPEVESGQALRKKFEKVEAAIDRNNKKNKITIKKKEDPNKLIEELFEANKVDRVKKIYNDTKPLLPNCDSELLINNIYDLIDWWLPQIPKSGKGRSGHTMFAPLHVLAAYVKKIEDIPVKYRSEKMFTKDSTLFKQFIMEFGESIGTNPIDGSYIN